MKESRYHISLNDFIAINWLPVGHRANQSVRSLVYKFFNGHSPIYMDHVFSPTNQRGIETRRSFQKLALPSRKSVPGQRSLSYKGPSLWNELPQHLKTCTSINSFKHALKRHYFELLNTCDNDIYAY